MRAKEKVDEVDGVSPEELAYAKSYRAPGREEQLSPEAQAAADEVLADVKPERSFGDSSGYDPERYGLTQADVAPTGDEQIAAPSTQAVQPRMPVVQEQVDRAPTRPVQTPVPTSQDQAAELKDLLSRYESAHKESSRRNKFDTGYATMLATSAPAAAQAYLHGREKYWNEPVAALEGENKFAGETLGTKQSFREDSPDSEESQFARQFVTENFGVKVPPNASYTQITKVFPMVKFDRENDTRVEKNRADALAKENKLLLDEKKYGETTRHNKASEGIKYQQEEGKNNRAKEINKVNLAIAGLRNSGESGVGQARLGMDLAQRIKSVPEVLTAGPDDKNIFLVPKKGIIPDPTDAKKITEGMEVAGGYLLALQKVQNIVTKNPRITPADPEYAELETALTEAQQLNIKYAGNGVANGPDIQQAAKQVGSAMGPDDIANPNAWIQFAKKAGPQKVAAVIEGLRRNVDNKISARGYQRATGDQASDWVKANGGSSAMGSGGGRKLEPQAETINDLVSTQTGGKPFVAPKQAAPAAKRPPEIGEIRTSSSGHSVEFKGMKDGKEVWQRTK